MNPKEGTEILFLEDGIWYNKNSAGVVVPTHTEDYMKRYVSNDTLVVVKGEDESFISNLNGGELTVVVDKNKIGKPDLLTLKNTKEWMSLSHFLKIRKMTDTFCGMAKNFHIPSK